MDILQSPNRVGRINVANNVTDAQAVAAAGFQLESIARVQPCRKSKKLMGWIKGIYSGMVDNARGLLYAKALSWQHAQKNTQGGQDCNKVDCGDAAGMRGQISGEKYLVTCADRHYGEQALSEYEP